MTTRRTLNTIAAMVAMLATAVFGSMATAQHEHGGATPGAQMGMTGTGVVYMTIENSGDEDDALIAASTDRAQAVEVHEMRIKDDVGMMMPHEGPLVIPAGKSVALEPGGLHLMLLNLNEDIRLGDTFDITLTFEHAGEVTVPVTAVLDAEDAEGEPVEAGELEITGVWSRPAPRIDGPSPGTPDASPAA